MPPAGMRHPGVHASHCVPCSMSHLVETKCGCWNSHEEAGSHMKGNEVVCSCTLSCDNPDISMASIPWTHQQHLVILPTAACVKTTLSCLCTHGYQQLGYQGYRGGAAGDMRSQHSASKRRRSRHDTGLSALVRRAVCFAPAILVISLLCTADSSELGVSSGRGLKGLAKCGYYFVQNQCPKGSYWLCFAGKAKRGCRAKAAGKFPAADCQKQCLFNSK